MLGLLYKGYSFFPHTTDHTRQQHPRGCIYNCHTQMLPMVAQPRLKQASFNEHCALEYSSVSSLLPQDNSYTPRKITPHLSGVRGSSRQNSVLHRPSTEKALSLLFWLQLPLRNSGEYGEQLIEDIRVAVGLNGVPPWHNSWSCFQVHVFRVSVCMCMCVCVRVCVCVCVCVCACMCVCVCE